VGVVALGFGRLLVLNGERGLRSPPGKVMMGDEKSQLLEIFPFIPKGNQITPSPLAVQGRAGQITEKPGLGNDQNTYLEPPL